MFVRQNAEPRKTSQSYLLSTANHSPEKRSGRVLIGTLPVSHKESEKSKDNNQYPLSPHETLHRTKKIKATYKDITPSLISGFGAAKYINNNGCKSEQLQKKIQQSIDLEKGLPQSGKSNNLSRQLSFQLEPISYVLRLFACLVCLFADNPYLPWTISLAEHMTFPALFLTMHIYSP